MRKTDFLDLLWEFYGAHARQLPWRQVQNDRINPYHVLVSEIMLQQTQVARVIPKYESFLQRYPDISSLASAPLGNVLRLWSGLGYNRRAKYLHQAAQRLEGKPFPRSIAALSALPGIGENTAAAILVYSYNEPHTFVETNIRTVLIHHFFEHDKSVNDRQIRQLLEALAYKKRPREFYWAMMDYGAFLKRNGSLAARKSKSYNKQSTFAGSSRQVRGAVLKELGAREKVSLHELARSINDSRLQEILQQLASERLIVLSNNSVSLP